MFIFVPERRPLKDEKITKKIIKHEFFKFIDLIKNVRKEKNILYCLLANFLAVDAVNTAIIFFTTFLENAVWHDVSGETMRNGVFLQMLALTISAIITSFIFGWLVDKIGSKKAFLMAALSMGCAAVCGCILSKGWAFFITITIFGGAGLSGVWTAGRKLFADITPHGKEGEYFGLYGLTNKSSALGMIIFAMITYLLPQAGLTSEPVAYRIAFLFPLFTICLSLFFLRKVNITFNSAKEPHKENE
jgi:UMF1 family MFS transporter